MVTEEEWDEVEDEIFMEKGETPEPYEVCNKIIETLTKHNSSSKKDCYIKSCNCRSPNKEAYPNCRAYTCLDRQRSPS